MGKQKDSVEEIVNQEDILLTKARRMTLEQNLQDSVFGTKSNTFNFKGINYGSSDLAGGIYGKAAEKGDWNKWSMEDNMALKANNPKIVSGKFNFVLFHH